MNSLFGFYVDMTRCTGCKTCMIACSDKHDHAASINWRRVLEYTGGSWIKDGDGFRQDVFSYYLSIACNHCRSPICIEVCPTTAMHLDVNGIVSVDPAKCQGCRYCQWACPYKAPQFDASKGVMTKCDFCKDNILQGTPPSCVAACPTRALQYCELEDLKRQTDAAGEVAPLCAAKLTEPSLFLKLHRMAKPIENTTGKNAAEEEL